VGRSDEPGRLLCAAIFMQRGHFAAVEVLVDLSDEAAIGRAEALFVERKQEFEGFEVWDVTQLVHRHPKPLPKSA